MARKLQYQGISKTLFVPAAAVVTVYVGPFSSFSQPLPPKSRAPQTQSVANTPVVPAKPSPVFTRFSEPQHKKAQTQSFTNAPRSAFVQPVVFSKFGEPSKRPPSNLGSVVYDPQPPASVPFTGFFRFEEPLRAKPSVALLGFQPFTPFIAPPADTHDGVYVRRKRRRGPDPIELEIQERQNRRAALELAVYGPPVEMTGEIPVIEPVAPPQPPNVEELTRVVMALQQAQQEAKRQADIAADEDDLEAILREIF